MALVDSQGCAEDHGSCDGDDDDDHDDDVWVLTLAMAVAFAAAGWLVLFTAPDEDRHGVRLVSAVALFVLAYLLVVRGVGRKEMAAGVSSLRPVVKSVLAPLPVPPSEWQLPVLAGVYRGYVVTVSTSEAMIVGTSTYSPASYTVSVSVPWASPRWSAVSDLCRFGERDAALKGVVRRTVAEILDESKPPGNRRLGPFGHSHIGYRRGRRDGEVFYCALRCAPLESLTPDQVEEQLELLIRVVQSTSAAIDRSTQGPDR